MFHVKHMSNDDIYKLLYKYAYKSAKNGDIPVSSLIIYDGKVIGKGYNNKHKTKNVLGHAEVNAIKQAQKKMGDWRLNDCILISTLKPCNMCAEIIHTARINEVYFLIDQTETNYKYKYKQIFDNNIYITKYEELFNNFFKTIR